MIKDITKIFNMDFGGKAYGLNKLIGFNVRVPKAFAINQEFIDRIIDNDTDCIQTLIEKLRIFKESRSIAVRSSASNEDGREKSFAGMYDSILNVPLDIDKILDAIKKVNNSRTSKRIKTYNKDNSKMNIVLQEMVNAKLAGVCFTKAIDFDGSNVMYIEYVEGLGESLVSGKKTAKSIIVRLNDFSCKCEEDVHNYFDDLINGLKTILSKTKEPLDIEWCIDESNKAYFVQARPITKDILIRKKMSDGAVASPGYCQGRVYKIDEDAPDEEIESRIINFPIGAILVAKTTDTNYVPAMKKAAGIITTEGSVLSHAAIVAREFGIPCITGFKAAFELFEDNKNLILNTNENKLIYDGNKINFGTGKEINLLELYDFDNITEEIVDNNLVLVEKVGEEFGIHVDEELNQDELDKIDIYIRKKYKDAPTVLKDQKFLWYDEYKRFQNFSLFNEYCQEARKVCKSFDSNGLIDLVDRILKDMKAVHDEAVTPFEKAYSLEYAQATHFIINLFLCSGCAMKEINNFMKETNNFYVENVMKKGNKQKEFLFNIEKIRESIWGIYVKNKWSSDEYFDNREVILASSINGNPEDDKIIDEFYEKVSLYEKKLS